MKQASLKLKPVPNGDKIEQIITVLQNYIIDGNLKAGDRIPPERQLASQLGVSRFSLREALRVAQTQGLIEISRGRCPQSRRTIGNRCRQCNRTYTAKVGKNFARFNRSKTSPRMSDCAARRRQSAAVAYRRDTANHRIDGAE